MTRRLKILLVSFRFPWPLTRGDTLTVYKMAEYFGARHDLDLLCAQPADPEGEVRLRPLVRELACLKFNLWQAAARTAAAVASDLPFQVAWCSTPALSAAASAMHAAWDYDLIVPYYVRTAEAVHHLAGPRKVVAMQLSLAHQWRRAARHAPNPLVRTLKSWEAGRLARYESAMFTRFDKCLVISPHDIETVAYVDEDKLVYNPHGVDTGKFAPRPKVPKTKGSVVFSGNMAFQPNEDAVCHFVEAVWPRVLAEEPGATFTIVGKEPTAKVRALAREPRVEVTGTVPGVEDFLARAEVAVDPLRIGGGLQNKVLEGLSMGLALVVSTIANEGIGAEDGRHLLLADDPEEFALKIVRLLRDERLRQTLGCHARQFIQEQWTWEYHFERLERLFLELCHEPDPVII
jgi:sugar transferase (PEP-CTERM/EpsH1 system associated)